MFERRAELVGAVVNHCENVLLRERRKLMLIEENIRHKLDLFKEMIAHEHCLLKEKLPEPQIFFRVGFGRNDYVFPLAVSEFLLLYKLIVLIDADKLHIIGEVAHTRFSQLFLRVLHRFKIVFVAVKAVFRRNFRLTLCAALSEFFLGKS